jgi:hypothetical protein
MIMDGVFASYISRLTDEYAKIETLSARVKETMLVDAKYMTERLSQLSGVRKMDQGLIQAVEAREVSVTKIGENDATKDEVLFDVNEPGTPADGEVKKVDV